MTSCTFADSRPCLATPCRGLIWHFTSEALRHWTVREQMLYSDCQWKRWEPISVNTWQLKLLLIKMPDCSRWVPFGTTWVSSWECHYKRHQIAADECLSVWKLAAETTTERDTTFYSKWETDWQLRQLKRCYSSKCDRAQHREQQTVQSSLPLFQQRFIQAKMHKSHANMAAWIYHCYASLISRLLICV